MGEELPTIAAAVENCGLFLESSDRWTGALPTFVCPRLDLRFLLVPAGSYLRGSDGPMADSDESPVRRITLSRPFLLAETPCSQTAWRKGAVNTQLPAEVAGLATSARFPVFGEAGEMPVYHVSWRECVCWCDANCLTLPTEAQWEYACRAGTDSEYWFGNVSEDDFDTLSRHLWFSEHNDSRCPRLGTLPVNPWGFYDMHGSVWEWCLDLYDAAFYRVGGEIDPCNMSTGDKRIHRGGAWDVPAICCRSSARYRDAEDYRLGSIGFRPAISLPAFQS